MMTWQDLHHSELTVPQLYALLKLRSEVLSWSSSAFIRMSTAMI